MDVDKKFASANEEIEYWKDLAIKYKESLAIAKEDLDEFQISSRELELELEAQLNQAENKNREFESLNSRLQLEVETLGEKLMKLQTSSHYQITELESKLEKTETFSSQLQKYVRELEQSNDDLERAKRAALVTLEDFEFRLNQTIERNAILENELDEKKELDVCVQRLKDEARDLRQELAVQSKVEKTSAPVKQPTHAPERNVQNQTEFKSEPSTPVRTLNPDYTIPTTPLTPAVCISALNIVSDLLRKVGNFESRFATCRALNGTMPPSRVREPSSVQPQSPTDSPSMKRVHLGEIAAV